MKRKEKCIFFGVVIALLVALAAWVWWPAESCLDELRRAGSHQRSRVDVDVHLDAFGEVGGDDVLPEGAHEGPDRTAAQ